MPVTASPEGWDQGFSIVFEIHTQCQNQGAQNLNQGV